MQFDFVVIGAGMVGSAIGYGLAAQGRQVLVIDGNDRDFRSANANFGLVWLHGKGIDMPAYHRLTYDAGDRWRDFAGALTDETGIGLEYERNGGLALCLGEAEFAQREANLQRLQSQLGDIVPDWEMIDRATLAGMLPHIRLGDEVTGASLGHGDGHANPLRLLAALQAGMQRRGGVLRGGAAVRTLRCDDAGRFIICFGNEEVTAARVVIAAGLGSRDLAAQVGLTIPIRPQRGQILVTERLEPILHLPTLDIRQTGNGTVMIGATHEEVGFDDSTTVAAGATLSARAIRQFPQLGEANLVRQWSGLRILTPDGYPIYAESESHPGAFVALCHSGVTLAPVHVDVVARAIADGGIPPTLNVFHHRRFDVPKAA